MGRTRDLFKKIRDTKGIFHAKMGSIKDRNGLDLTEAEDIKKRWLEYTEELYRKVLHDPDNHDVVMTHLEPDILEGEVKWALESITTNKEHPGLFSFRMDWLDLLAVQGTLKSLLQHHSSKASMLWRSAFFTVLLSHPYMTTGAVTL